MRQCAQFQFRMPGHPFCIVIIQRDHILFRHLIKIISLLINLIEAKIYIHIAFIHICVTGALSEKRPVFAMLSAIVTPATRWIPYRLSGSPLDAVLIVDTGYLNRRRWSWVNKRIPDKIIFGLVTGNPRYNQWRQHEVAHNAQRTKIPREIIRIVGGMIR